MGVFDGVKGLSPKQAQTLERNLEKAGGISVREYGRREVVLRRGEDPGGIGILQNGLLLLESVNLDGQRRIMDYYGRETCSGKGAFRIWKKGFIT